MTFFALALVTQPPENAPNAGVTTMDWLGMVFIGVLVTVLWLAFRRLKGLSDEPPKPDGPKP